jgi:hypothetical protein
MQAQVTHAALRLALSSLLTSLWVAARARCCRGVHICGPSHSSASVDIHHILSRNTFNLLDQLVSRQLQSPNICRWAESQFHAIGFGHRTDGMQWHLILIEALALNNAPTLSAFPTGARRFFNYSCLCDKLCNTLANSPRSCFPADGISNRSGAAFGQELCGNFAFVAAAAIAVRCGAGRVR